MRFRREKKMTNKAAEVQRYINQRLRLFVGDDFERSGLAQPTWVTRPLDAPEWTPAGRAAFERNLMLMRAEERLAIAAHARKRPTVMQRLLGRLVAIYAIWKVAS